MTNLALLSDSEVAVGRPLTLDEARQFTNIARRLTALAMLAPDLDLNYRAATGDVDQDGLWEAAA